MEAGQPLELLELPEQEPQQHALLDQGEAILLPHASHSHSAHRKHNELVGTQPRDHAADVQPQSNRLYAEGYNSIKFKGKSDDDISSPWKLAVESTTHLLQCEVAQIHQERQHDRDAISVQVDVCFQTAVQAKEDGWRPSELRLVL